MTGFQRRLKLTPAALDLLYGGSLVCLVSETLIDRLLERFQTVWGKNGEQAPSLLALTNEGALCSPGEDPSEAYLSPFGAPAGIVGILIAHQDPRTDWLISALFARDGAQTPPKSYRVHVEDDVAIDRMIARMFMETSLRLLDRVADQDALIVSQRLDLEHRDQTLARMTQRLEASGNDSYLAVTLPAGERVTALTTAENGAVLRSRLPVKGMGLQGLGLYLAAPAKPGICLNISLGAAATGLIIFQKTMSLDHLSRGWFDVKLSPALSVDEELDLLLSVDTVDGEVQLALADTATDRFGIEGRTESLALRLFKTDLVPARGDTGIVISHASGVPLTDLTSFVDFAGTDAERERAAASLGANPIEFRRSDGYLQTHPILFQDSGVIAGAVIDGALSASLTGLSALVALDHPRAAPATAILVACPATTPADEYQALLKAATEGTLPPTCRGASVALEAERTRRIDLDLSDAPSDLGTLLLGAVPAEGRTDFGFCRWHRLIRTVGPSVPTMDIPVKGPETVPLRRQTLPISGWDLAAQSQFIEGQGAQARLEAELGYPVLEVHRERAVLQVHPVMNQTSAVVCSSIIPADAVCFKVSVQTAHPSAPDFIYGALAIPSGLDVKAVLDGLVDRLPAHVGAGLGGQSEDGVCWQVVLGTAEQRKQLVLALPETSGSKDLLLFTLPAAGTTSYGWCQFLDPSLDFEIPDPAHGSER